MPVSHAKTNNIPSWSQADMDLENARYYAAYGTYLFPPGSTIADITLSQDWNSPHNVSVSMSEINATGTPDATTWLRGDGTWAGNPLGDVTGPAGATDNAITRYDTATGKLIQNSNMLLTDGGSLVMTAQNNPSYVAGQFGYDLDTDAPFFDNADSDVRLNIGQEEWVRVRNVSGSSIGNGVAVQISGANSGLPTITLAQANANIVAVGLTTEVIANNTNGWVTRGGAVRGVDTSAFAAGATLFVSSAVAGALTTTAPAAPNYRIRIGTVLASNATTGVILVTNPTSTLGFGAANQVMGMNAAGTAPEYKTATTSTTNTIVHGVGTIQVRRTALTGDITAPANSNATTLATVNANVGSFGSASSVMTQTVNAKGLTTAAASVAIQIAESQVTNLVSDLAAKQPNITLTTTGTTGPATFISNTLNVPQYNSGTTTPYAETPSGLVNGSNTVYTLANSPANSAGVIVVLDGVVQRNGVDYTVTGTTITFAAAPAALSEIFAYYNTATTGTGLPYVDVTGTSITMAANTIYYPNNAGLVTLTLPATFNQNDQFSIIGKGAGGWRIAQQSGQTIRLTGASTTTGAGGSISSTNRYDNIVLRGLIANTDISATVRNGTLTVV